MDLFQWAPIVLPWWQNYSCFVMMSLSDDTHADINDTYNTTSRFLDDILNVNNIYFDNMVSQIPFRAQESQYL